MIQDECVCCPKLPNRLFQKGRLEIGYLELKRNLPDTVALCTSEAARASDHEAKERFRELKSGCGLSGRNPVVTDYCLAWA